MTIYGYVRESFLKTPETLSVENQKKLLEEKGVDVLLIEQADPLTNQTTTFDSLLKELKPGDQLWVSQLHRLARDKKQLFALHTQLKIVGVDLFSLDCPEKNGENGENGETKETSINEYFEWLNTQEDFVKKERQKTGMRRAFLAGNGGGRKPLINDQLKNNIQKNLLLGLSKAQIARNLEISRVTLYKALSQLEDEKNTF